MTWYLDIEEKDPEAKCVRLHMIFLVRNSTFWSSVLWASGSCKAGTLPHRLWTSSCCPLRWTTPGQGQVQFQARFWFSAAPSTPEHFWNQWEMLLHKPCKCSALCVQKWTPAFGSTRLTARRKLQSLWCLQTANMELSSKAARFGGAKLRY